MHREMAPCLPGGEPPLGCIQSPSLAVLFDWTQVSSSEPQFPSLLNETRRNTQACVPQSCVLRRKGKEEGHVCRIEMTK